MLQLTQQKVHFVTRLRDSVEYGIVAQLGEPEDKGILRDEVVLLCSQQDLGPEALLRRVAASTIAASYKGLCAGLSARD